MSGNKKKKYFFRKNNEPNNKVPKNEDYDEDYADERDDIAEEKKEEQKSPSFYQNKTEDIKTYEEEREKYSNESQKEVQDFDWQNYGENKEETPIKQEEKEIEIFEEEKAEYLEEDITEEKETKKDFYQEPKEESEKTGIIYFDDDDMKEEKVEKEQKDDFLFDRPSKTFSLEEAIKEAERELGEEKREEEKSTNDNFDIYHFEKKWGHPIDIPKEELEEEKEEVQDAKIEEVKKEEVKQQEQYPKAQQAQSPKKQEEKRKKEKQPFYFGYKLRILLLVIGTLILFCLACFIIVSALDANSIETLKYKETTTIDYEVCLIDSPECLEKDNTYSNSDTSTIHYTFHYKAEYEEEKELTKKYQVIAVKKIYDRNDINKVLYEEEEKITSNTKTSTAKDLEFEAVGDIDYSKYREFAENYFEEYASDASAMVSLVLEIEEEKKTRQISQIDIPLGLEEYNITTENETDEKREEQVAKQEWTNMNTLFVVVGSVCVLLSLILLSQLTRLALATAPKKSKYQERLEEILNKYDRLIVIARDGFETDIAKKIVKVDDFKELLDAREIINKPIIYSKVNNIKSEFIVEDTDTIYKYTLKEADIED